MTSSSPALRSLIIYAVVVPLALWIGYVLAESQGLGTLGWVGVVLFALTLPLMLKWHHPLLFLVWNMTAIIYFLPGAPQLWLLMAGLSLAISIVQRAMQKEVSFISAPSITAPVLFILLVVLATGRLTGGFGVRAMGGELAGGKGYFWIAGGVAGYFAMTACRIPEEKANLYLGLFFLGALTNAIGSTLAFVPSELYFIFMIFPVDALGMLPSLYQENISRFFGLTIAAMGAFFYLLARFGISGILQWSRLGRVFLLLAILVVAALGGFRSFLILMVMTCFVLFYFEGLFGTKYAAILFGSVILAGALLVPFSTKLPIGVQRSLSFLPLKIDPVVRYDAENSTQWRVEMWQTTVANWPVWTDPAHNWWRAKGLLLSSTDIDLTTQLARENRISSQELMMAAGDYHNGPLTILIPFGIWGAIGWLWFLIASIRGLYLNYRYGDRRLKTINTLLLAYFVARTIHFFVVFGSFRMDFAAFAGLIGLSLALNHGIRKRAVATRAIAEPVALRPRPALVH